MIFDLKILHHATKIQNFFTFFFTRLRDNTYDDRPHFSTFPYVSLCGRERNFVRCADVPLVLTRLLDNADLFECCHIPSTMLSVRFQPERLYVKPDTGRIYHPAPDNLHIRIALIKDAIAERLSSHFTYSDTNKTVPTTIEWKGKVYEMKIDDNMAKNVHEHSRFEC